MSGQQALKINYNESAANLQVTPLPPQTFSFPAGRQHIGIQHHIQPSIQTPKFQPLQHLVVVHLRNEFEVERNLDGSFQRGNNSPGDITIIPADCDYQLTTTQESEVLLLTLDPDWLSHLADELVEPAHLGIRPHFPQADPLIYGIGLALHTELRSNTFRDSFYVESLCNTLSMHLLKRYSSLHQSVIQDLNGGLSRQRLSQVLDYIDAHLDEEIDVSHLSVIANMSRYYFASLFKQAIGTSPYQYVLVQRVERAKRLLHQKEISLADVASACGFANQSHFTRRFRQLVGITPKAYQDAVRV